MTTALLITAITAAETGLVRLDLEDGSHCRVSPPWMVKNKPYVGGYLVDGKDEQWFAAPSRPGLSVDPVRVELAKLSLKPGDVLAMKVPAGTPMRGAEQIKGHIEKMLPEGVKSVLFLGDIELTVLENAGEVQP